MREKKGERGYESRQIEQANLLIHLHHDSIFELKHSVDICHIICAEINTQMYVTPDQWWRG